jgi:hypothetical protein
MDEVPDRSIIHLETALGEFGHQPAQGKVLLLDPLQQPGAMLARDRLRLVPAHLARCDAAGLSEAPNPGDHRTDADAKLRRCLAPRQAALLNRGNNPFAKIKRIRLSHPYWPPIQSQL